MPKSELTKEQKEVIDNMSHEQMAYLYRFAPPGHKYFRRYSSEESKYFLNRFYSLGGMTSEMSKRLGWAPLHSLVTWTNAID